MAGTIVPRACLKNHSYQMHAPLCVIFAPNSGYIARYAPFIWHKSPTNCVAHLAESIFQTRPSVYADCVASGKAFSELEFVFDMQYPDGVIREAGYSFCMSKQKLTEEKLREKYKEVPEDFEIPEEDYKVIVFDE